MQLCVLDPSSKDPDQTFPDFAGKPDLTKQSPLGYRGLAACTGGGYYRKDSSIPAHERRVLLVLHRNLKACRQNVINLRRAGKTIILAWSKPGAFELETILRSPSDLSLFREICGRAHGAIAVTSDVEPVFRGGGVLHVETIPMPLPVESPEWDFSIRPEDRQGIFLGTWDRSDVTRRHLTALMGLRDVVSQMYEPLTVFNLDGWRGRRWLRQLGYPSGLLRVIERRLPHAEYLRKMATHKMVFQLDASGGPGRVAGDALLCRIPCIGGNGVTEQIIFPELSDLRTSTPDTLYAVSRLLDHGHDRELAVEQALNLAKQRLSFEVIQQSLEQLFHCFG
jgi:hypothetical protein